ncbi:methyl-accepting chemotaxis protein [Enterovibrio sp. ZSDZ35]|uniref:Methyl-accepting chemotaxis protein n=1 Tax=Enterovibrio qingdaonensis TaxID=2899818 RepID=A0ABT5QH46_9GAMM|nr:methyl-accepting chemotaxis protein [Enterovibrio sp. ZSDZ35]MDD1780033.1 methyl-accepting chemotaxis protein [Enterovibrio sp. ZSDZ35]
MLGKLKLAQQLTVSFSAVLVLLLVVSIVGYGGLSEGFKNFTDYRGLARSSNEASEAEATLLSARLTALKFLKTQDPALIDKVEKEIAHIDKVIDIMLSHESDPTRINELNESKVLMAKYGETFALIVKDFADRNLVVQQDLDPNGLKMRQTMTKIIEDSAADREVDSLFYASQAQQNLLLGRLFAAKFLISNSDQDLNRSLNELNDVIAPLNQLKRLLTSPEEREMVDAFSNAHLSYTSALQQTAEIIHARNKRISGTLDVIGPQVTTNLGDFKASIRSSQDTLGPEAQSDSEAAVQTVITVSAVAILVGILLSILVARAIRRPIGGEPSEIEQIARNIATGDLTQSFDNKEQPTGIFAAMGEMNGNLKDIVGQLSSSVDTLNNASGTLVSVTEETSRNTESQSEQLEQTATAMHQLTATVDDIAQNAQKASDIANEADRYSQEGQSVLDDTRNSIENLVGNIGEVSQVIENLEAETKNVGSILDTIRGIAEQTNLLALNAAIEAARAGEQGRGFAVVADEVRSLASRTQQSTEEIQTLITRLQSESKRSVESMRKSASEAEETSSKANKTRDALISITESVSNIRDMNHQIAIAAEEQNSVVANVNQAVKQLNELGKSTASGTEKLSKEAHGLTTITTGVNQIVGKFSIG